MFKNDRATLMIDMAVGLLGYLIEKNSLKNMSKL